jgi:hypothetical protein
MKKAAKLFYGALSILAIVAILGCVSSASAGKVAGTWKAVNPRADNLNYTLVAAKDTLTFTATNALDGAAIGSLKMKIKEAKEKECRLSGPISSSDGIYKALTGTGYVNFTFDDTSQKGLSVLYIALSASSYPDFSPQLAYVKQ